MSKTKGNLHRNGVNQALVSQWACPVAYRSHLVDLVRALCEDCDSLLSKRVALALDTNNFDSLLKLSCDPKSYMDIKSYYKDNLLLSLVKKYPHWATSIDPRVEAMKTFISCEVDCMDTNRNIFEKRALSQPNSVITSVISTASRKISSILGNVPTMSSLPVEFGDGASFTVKGRTSSYNHITGALDVTPKALGLAIDLLRHCPGWLSLHGVSPDDTARIKDCVTLLPGSRLTFVPKTAKTDRPINIEPALNKVLQKGVGSCIRKKLKRNGVNLNRNPERHLLLARKGSKDGSLATVDLSSASDTISYAIVMELLPFNWFELLDKLRCERYQIEDKWYDFHKFSAMGNGYTFELESLIFYALAFAVCVELGLDTSDVSVFGDDIIIPTGAYDLLTEVLAQCGFSVNEEKSFSSGPFRESCGGDFFDGSFCRGFYIKDYLDLRTLVRFRNYLHRHGFQFWTPALWRKVRKLTAKWECVLAGPDDGTDDHIIYNDMVRQGQRYNVVQVFDKGHKLPKRWHSARVWMLYNSSLARQGEENLFLDRWESRPVRILKRPNQPDVEHRLPSGRIKVALSYRT